MFILRPCLTVVLSCHTLAPASTFACTDLVGCVRRADRTVDQMAFNNAVLSQAEHPWQHLNAKTQAFPSALSVAQELYAKYTENA